MRCRIRSGRTAQSAHEADEDPASTDEDCEDVEYEDDVGQQRSNTDDDHSDEEVSGHDGWLGRGTSDHGGDTPEFREEVHQEAEQDEEIAAQDADLDDQPIRGDEEAAGPTGRDGQELEAPEKCGPDASVGAKLPRSSADRNGRKSKDRRRKPNAVRVDPEFEELVQRMSEEEYQELEQSMLQHGCRDRIVVWGPDRMVLDGHTRLSICRKHNLPYETTEVKLPDRLAAREFIIRNQLGRRNLTREQLRHLRGQLYNSRNPGQGGDRRSKRTRDQSDRLKTDEKVAADTGVSPATVRRDGKFAKALDSIASVDGGKALKQEILSGKSGLTLQDIAAIAKAHLRSGRRRSRRPWRTRRGERTRPTRSHRPRQLLPRQRRLRQLTASEWLCWENLRRPSC